MPQPAGKGLCVYTSGRESRQMVGGGEEKKEREREKGMTTLDFITSVTLITPNRVNPYSQYK